MSDIAAVYTWVEMTGLQFPGFDREYYVTANPDVAALNIDPFQHYLDHGWKEGRRPSLGFDGDAYLEINPDVRSSGMNPLVHFVLYGLSENRGFGHNNASQSLESPISAPVDMPGFDRKYYIDNNPDVIIDNLDPLVHYLEHGWKEGRKPSHGFNGDLYLALNPDIASAEINPLVHFVRYGIAEGRYWSSVHLEDSAEKTSELSAGCEGARIL